MPPLGKRGNVPLELARKERGSPNTSPMIRLTGEREQKTKKTAFVLLTKGRKEKEKRG